MLIDHKYWLFFGGGGEGGEIKGRGEGGKGRGSENFILQSWSVFVVDWDSVSELVWT